jgi:hypothetical protein
MSEASSPDTATNRTIWTRRNQISSFDETDESIYIGRGVSSVDYWQPSCAHQPAGFVLLVQACVLQSCDAYWLPTPFSSFPFTSPPVRHRVPSHFKRSLPHIDVETSKKINSVDRWPLCVHCVLNDRFVFTVFWINCYTGTLCGSFLVSSIT